jgi:LacI family transcriptional regulator
MTAKTLDGKDNRPTTRDVARVANVSLGTVSRVLNDASNVREDLRQRVLEAIVLLDFVPHAFAQGLRRKSTRTIACIVSNISLPLFARHVAGVESVLHGLGYSLLLMNTHDSPAREREAYAFVDKQRIDGIITTLSNEDDHQGLSKLTAAKTPTVLLERDVDGFDRVLSDHRSGVEQATAYLIGLGHRRISLITVPTSNWPGRERKIGMELAFEKAMLPVPANLIFTSGSSADYGYHAANQMLIGRSRPTAFIVGGNQLIGVIKAIKLARLRIPEDISLVCLGNTDFGEVFSPPITEVLWRVEMLGEMAAKIILARLSDDARGDIQRLVLPTELVLRGSCAPPPLE